MAGDKLHGVGDQLTQYPVVEYGYKKYYSRDLQITSKLGQPRMLYPQKTDPR